MAIFIIKKMGDPFPRTSDIGIVLEGVEVLNNLTSVASAFAFLLGLTYALNLSYPKDLKLTFEVLQKVFMQLDDQKMSAKVQSLNTKLYKLQWAKHSYLSQHYSTSLIFLLFHKC